MFDGADRLAVVTDALGDRTTSLLDNVGNVTGLIDDLGRVSNYLLEAQDWAHGDHRSGRSDETTLNVTAIVPAETLRLVPGPAIISAVKVTVSMYCNHVPQHRQQNISTRQ